MTYPWSDKLLLHLSLAIIASLLTSCGPISDDDSYAASSYYDYYAPPNTTYYSDAASSPILLSNTSPVSEPEKANTKSVRGHQAGPKNFRTVIIDAGHGGHDSGARVAGVAEKTLALDVSRRIKRELDGSFKVVFIRNGDYFVDLDRRVRATKPFDDAIFISIHLNHGKSSRLRGPETYYFRVDSYSLAKRIQRNMAAVSPVEKNRGLVRRRLRLTRNTEIPSVLVELGYLSNSADRQLLNTASYRQRMATAIANAVKTQNKKGDSGMGKLPKPLNRPLSRASDKAEL